MREFEGSVELDGLDEEARIHDQDHVGGAPLVIADIGLFEEERAALVELAEDSPAVVDVADSPAFEAGDPVLGGIDPELAGHAFESLGFEVFWIEAGVGLEAEAITGALWRFCKAGEGVEEHASGRKRA